MNKTETLNALFEQWEKEIPIYGGCFVKDGIVNESIWNNTNPRILFIAKEANHYDNPTAGDFREEWKTGNCKYVFAKRIAEWAFGLIEGFRKFSDIEYSKTLHQDYLQKIAFMNIKKSGGGSRSHHAILKEHLNKRHVQFLQQQIQIIDPEIIVFCLSFNNELKELIFPGICYEMQQCGYSIEVGKFNNIKVIDFYHPSSRNGPAAAYSLLQNVTQSEVFRNLE